MSFTPLTFTGISQYSTDFQTILTRAVNIAQIPVKQLQNKDADVLQRKGLLGGLAGAVNQLAADLKTLGDTATNRALAAFSSDSTAVSVSNTGATSAGSFTINTITSAASSAGERSTNSFLDAAATPFSASGTVKLVVGTVEKQTTLTNNTLVGVRDWINSQGVGVTASILTTADGNYLSIAANFTGATTLQLIENPDVTPVNLLTSANQGTNAVFTLNGISVNQKGNVVNSVVPGLTFTINKASAVPITLSLASSRGQLSSALNSFVGSFNSARNTVNAQIGANAGLLTGDTVITQLSTQLREIASYQTSSGGVKNLALLGITFNSSGQASLDSKVFDALSDTSISDAFTYLGSATTGFGKFSRTLTQFGDPLTGLIRIAQDGLDRTDKNLQKRIDAANDRITIMQNSLASRLQATDALLGSLASQQRMLGASLQGLSLTLYGKNLSQ